MSSIPSSIPRLSFPPAIATPGEHTTRRSLPIVTGKSVRALAAKFNGSGAAAPAPNAKGFWTGSPEAVRAFARKRVSDPGPRAVVDIAAADEQTFEAHKAIQVELAARLGHTSPKVDRSSPTIKTPAGASDPPMATSVVSSQSPGPKSMVSAASSPAEDLVKTAKNGSTEGDGLQDKAAIVTPPQKARSPKRVTFSDTPMVKIFVTGEIIDTFSPPKLAPPTPKSVSLPPSRAPTRKAPTSTPRTKLVVPKAGPPLSAKASPLASKSTNIPLKGLGLKFKSPAPATQAKSTATKAKFGISPCSGSATRKTSPSLQVKVTPKQVVPSPRTTKKAGGKENAQRSVSGARPPWKP